MVTRRQDTRMDEHFPLQLFDNSDIVHFIDKSCKIGPEAIPRLHSGLVAGPLHNGNI